MSSDHDHTRSAYLAGNEDGSLPACEPFAGLAELRVLLASPAVWVQPRASLEEDVVAAVVQAARILAPEKRPLNRRTGRRLACSRPALRVAREQSTFLSTRVHVNRRSRSSADTPARLTRPAPPAGGRAAHRGGGAPGDRGSTVVVPSLKARSGDRVTRPSSDPGGPCGARRVVVLSRCAEHSWEPCR